MFCENCGVNIPDNSKFCTGCGTSFTGAAPVASVQQPVQTAKSEPPPQPAYTPQPQPQPAYASHPQRPVYSPPPPQQPYYNQTAGYGAIQANREPLKVGSYIGMFFLSAIPIVGFIMLLVWAFGSSVNLNKKNYARAILIMGLIGIGIWIVLLIIGVIIGGSIFNSMY